METKKRILLVDDEQDLVDIVKMRLEANGYSVLTALDGKDALDTARRERLDLIILDLMLPKIDGYRVCAMLKRDQKYSKIPIILFTARAQESDVKMGTEAGKVEIKKGRTDIVALAKRVVFAFYSSVSDKGLELRERYSKDTIEAEVDTDRITQVFTNLISNAIKFAEKGYIEIAVEDKEDAVYCSVSDTGIGIPEEELPRVFNKFEQFRPLGGGAGLGLTISKGIIEMHHGRIWAESMPGEGSRFIFTLPKGKGL